MANPPDPPALTSVSCRVEKSSSRETNIHKRFTNGWREEVETHLYCRINCLTVVSTRRVGQGLCNTEDDDYLDEPTVALHAIH